jgi:phenylacetate-CoA ligase
MSDSLMTSAERCPCGLPFSVLAGIDGRREETIMLRARAGGEVEVRPNVFHRALEGVAAAEWQVEQTDDALVVRLGDAAPSADDSRIADAVRRELDGVGAVAPSVHVERVARIARSALGKAPLVKARRPKRAEANAP